MNLRNKIKKLNIKQIVLFVIGILLIVGTLAGIIAITSNPSKKISSSNFKRGALDENGNYIKSNTQLVTEDLFECQGLAIKQDFDSFSCYEIFYYRADKTFIGSTGLLTGDYEKNSFANAKYARVVLTPELKEGKEKIGFFDILGYVKEFKITVLKDQSFTPPTEQLFKDIEKKFFATDADFKSAYTVVLADSPFAMANLEAFENKTITKIGVPISLIADPTVDNYFTFFIVEGDGTNNFIEIDRIVCTIPANTYKNLSQVTSADIGSSDISEVKPGEYLPMFEGYYKVQEWYYFDVNITIGYNQTLGFGASYDTAVFAYNKDTSIIDYEYGTYNTLFDTPYLLGSIWTYLDVYVLK